ncbi:MAG TPA: GNAT family N-acetyltransferase [Steroidobacteraceae bacterium]|nr:GNAT family N-acetyltransferase [Steroidobacteraceae bacterium]
MPRGLQITVPLSAPEWAGARALLLDYAAALGIDLCFQGFAGELERLPAEYGPPDGAFLLAQLDGQPVDCIALRPFDAGRGEVKRLYVADSVRGRGIGRALAVAIIGRARALSYRQLVLDTLESMVSAQALYRSLGFRPVAAYRFNPLPGVAYLGLELAPGPVDDGPRPPRADAAGSNE